MILPETRKKPGKREMILRVYQDFMIKLGFFQREQKDILHKVDEEYRNQALKKVRENFDGK